MGHRAIIIDRYLDPVTALTQTNHAMSVRDGGKEDDLCGFALDGVRLCGSLAAAEGTRLRFQTDMETNLDDASRSDCGIRDPIDAWTYAEGVNAPPAPAFCKVWHPDQHRVAAAKAVRDAPDLAAPAVRRWQGLRRGDDDLDLRAPRSD